MKISIQTNWNFVEITMTTSSEGTLAIQLTVHRQDTLGGWMYSSSSHSRGGCQGVISHHQGPLPGRESI